MDVIHVTKLKEIICAGHLNQGEIGTNLLSWWNYVREEKPCNLPNNKLNRSEIKKICKHDSGYSEAECIAAVMAWGGQNRKHGKILFNRLSEIEPIVMQMRAGKISILEAYSAFDQIWKSKEPLGMGAAYFTKLIFFCEPSHKGYIMDQWTSKSINLIMGNPVVDLNYGLVTKKNNADNYKLFCELIEKLALDNGISGEEAEIAIFSRGGKKKAPWRHYVVEQLAKEAA